MPARAAHLLAGACALLRCALAQPPCALGTCSATTPSPTPAALPLFVAQLGPVLAWEFDGNLASSVDGVVLTPVGAPAFVPGVSGSGVSLASVGSYLWSVNGIPQLPTGGSPRTVSMWVKSPPLQADTSTSWDWDRHVFAAWGTPWGRLRSFTFGVGPRFPPEHRLFFDTWDAGVNSLQDVRIIADPPQWRHVALTFSLDHVAMYADGLPIAAGGGHPQWMPGISVDTPPNTPLYVGAGWPLGRAPRVPGVSLDRLYIFNRSLTAIEVAQLAGIFSPTPSITSTPTHTPSPSLTPSPSIEPDCGARFTLLPFTDVDGAVLAVLPGTPSEHECQLACCRAAPACGAYVLGRTSSECFLLANTSSYVVAHSYNAGVLRPAAS